MWLSDDSVRGSWSRTVALWLAAVTLAVATSACVGERFADVMEATAWIDAPERCPAAPDALGAIHASGTPASSVVAGPTSRADFPATCCYSELPLGTPISLEDSVDTPDGKCVLAHDDGTCPTDDELRAGAYCFGNPCPSAYGTPTLHAPRASCRYDVKR
jgi:hypothetical protein